MLHLVVFAIGFIASISAEVPLLPGAPPASVSSRYAPFHEISIGRIINGDRAAKGQFPWQTAIYLNTPQGTMFCGGALIASEWVLTAAHCVQGVTGAKILLGIVDQSDESVLEVDAIAVASHPQYNSRNFTNDIALLQLDQSVNTNSNIQTISLASNRLGDGVGVTVSGFGRVSDTSDVSQYLNYVALNTITNSECDRTYGGVPTEAVCCKGSNNKSTCQGDSGGPLITGSGNNAVHVGIVSFGSSAGCAKGYPVAFTRTASYRDFIRQYAGV